MTEKNDVYQNKEIVADIVNTYVQVRGDEFTDEQRAAVVAQLANKYGKSEASIRGKLYREDVYRAKTYKTKTGKPVISKSQLVDDVANTLNIEFTDSEGAALEKATKSVLNKILAGVQALHDEIDLVDVVVPEDSDAEAA